MAYMSYCRFEGTLYELRACLSDVQEHIEGEAECEVSSGEIEKFKMMVHEFVGFLNETGILDNEGEIDETILDDISQMMEERK